MFVTIGFLLYNRYKKKLEESEPEFKHNVMRRLWQVVVDLIVIALLLFVSAGGLDWPYAWLYMVLLSLVMDSKTQHSIAYSYIADAKMAIGVGIAVPGLVDHEEGYVVQGRVIDNTGMNCAEFSKYIPYPTKLIHDSYASGYSEIWMSSEMHNAFYISLCDSVGGSVLLNDSVYMGDGLYSGEIGHLNLIPNGERCYCGQRGCFDAYCNAEVLANYTDCDLGLFFILLKQGDEKLQKVWDEYLDHLATAVSDVRMLFGGTVILGGYIGAYMKDYMEILFKKVDAKSPFGESSESYLVPCKNKIESVATGAALFFVQEFLSDI